MAGNLKQDGGDRPPSGSPLGHRLSAGLSTLSEARGNLAAAVPLKGIAGDL